MAEEIKVGDTVRLKSGGPVMTVQDTGEYAGVSDGAVCIWFDGKNRKTEVFGRATLEKADPQRPQVSVVRG